MNEKELSDKEAAEKWRLQQAKEILEQYKEMKESKEIKVNVIKKDIPGRTIKVNVIKEPEEEKGDNLKSITVYKMKQEKQD